MNKNSFTLIELLITISLIIIFSGLSLASYHQFNETKKLEVETKKFVEVLELAKKKIQSGDKENFDTLNPPSKYSGCDLIAYKVTINPPTQYSLKAYICANGNTSCSLSNNVCIDANIYNYRSPLEITFSPLTTVIFYPFSKSFFEPPPTPPSNFRCLTITNTNTGKSKLIKIDYSGVVNIVSSCP